MRRKRLLAGVPEWRMADIVTQRDRLGQRLVEREGSRQRAGDLCHLQGMCQASDEVIALRVQEDLGLVFQAPEGLRVNDPIAIAFEGCPIPIWLFSPGTPTARSRPRGKRREVLLLGLACEPIPTEKVRHGPMMTALGVARRTGFEPAT